MEALFAIIVALFDLLRAVLQVLGRVLQQAGTFFQSTFGAEGGPLLMGSAILLIAAALLHSFLSRLDPARGDDSGPRSTAYFAGFGLIVLALATLVHARMSTGLANPGQRPVLWILLVVAGAHFLWFAGDLLSEMLGWRKGQRFFRRVHANRTAYYLVLPTFVLMGIFLYTPAVSIFYYSFFQYDLGGSKEMIGLGHYVRLLQDDVFLKSAGNMLILTVLSTLLSLSVPLIVAELIFHLRTERMRYYMRAAFLIPMVIPGVIVFLIWKEFYSDAGLIPLLGHLLGLGDRLEGLLSGPRTALFAVIAVGFPFVAGINLLIFYAGLNNIDEAVWEAAELDGAKPLKRFLAIDLPLLARQFKLLLILAVIGGVQAFENVLVMTQGGPGWETMLPGLYMYRSATSFNEYGFACAIGVVLFLFVLFLTFIVNRGFRNRDSL